MKKALCILLVGLLYTPTVLGATVPAPIEKSGIASEVINFSKQDFLSALPEALQKSLTGVRFYGIPETKTGTLVAPSGVLTDGQPLAADALNNLCFQSYRKDAHQVVLFWNAESDGTVIGEEGEILLTLRASDNETTSPDKKPETSPIQEETKLPQPIYIDMNGHWGEYSAKKLFDEGIWVGEKLGANRYFYPEKAVTRLDFLLALIATLEENYNEVQSSTPLFADEFIYDDYVMRPAKWAYEKGILSGSLQNGTRYFNPYEPITRAEAATMVRQTLLLQVPQSRSDFNYSDQKNIPSWALESVRGLRAYGVMKGFEDNTFQPNRTINRAEAAEVLVQLRKLILEEDVLSAQLLS